LNPAPKNATYTAKNKKEGRKNVSNELKKMPRINLPRNRPKSCPTIVRFRGGRNSDGNFAKESRGNVSSARKKGEVRTQNPGDQNLCSLPGRSDRGAEARRHGFFISEKPGRRKGVSGEKGI